MKNNLKDVRMGGEGKHDKNCVWELANCDYKATHHYCPHPEHAYSCNAPMDSKVNFMQVGKMTECGKCHPEKYKDLQTDVRDLIGRISKMEGDKETKAIKDAAEMLWVVLANVSGGDWTKQTSEWQEAARRWRDNYFQALVPTEVKCKNC